jgi:hypothetical protein
MPQLHSELLPPTIRCPHCNAKMDLDEQERARKTFDCPACRKQIDLSEPRSAPTSNGEIKPLAVSVSKAKDWVRGLSGKGKTVLVVGSLLFFVLLVRSCQGPSSRLSDKSNSSSHESDTRSAQREVSPVGSWSYNDGVYEITLVIYSGGSYFYSDNNGSSNGHWEMSGSLIYLQDSESRQSYYFNGSSIRCGNFTLSRK